MPLYDQSTNLAAQGRFAPGVNYRADIRKPTQPMPNFPEGKYQFNVDLDSVGKALAQMSRDQASVDETRFKLEYAKKEKAEAAAEKQLKIDTSNALAQEISDVTAQLDQGLINPLTASRMQKEIKDRYRAMGILDASQIASTANAEDGGASTFLEKRREQYGNWELGEKTKRLTDIHNKVPSSNNLSDAEALNLSYNIEQAGIKAAAAAISAKNNSGTQELATLSNQTLLREGMDAALYQATSTISNAVTTTPNMTPNQVLQNASMNTFRYFKDELGASDEIAYAAMTSAMDKIKPITDIWNKGTEEEAKFVKNKLSIVQDTAKLNLWSQFPSQMTAAQEKNIMFPGIQYAGPESEKPGAIIAPAPAVQTTAQYAQQGSSFVSTQVPTSVTFANGVTLPLTEETAYISRHPEEYMLSIATGNVPVGPYLGRSVALGTVAAAGYNGNINLSGERAASASAQDLRTAAANGKSFYGNINTAAGQNFLKKQGEYDGVSNYNKIFESYNTSEGLDIRANDPEHWNQVYFEHGRPIQDSNYLYNFLRIAPDGSLQMAPVTGKINNIVDALAADEFKEHIRAINIETSGYEPKARASLIRSLVNKNGQGVPTADPQTDMILSSDSTFTEKAVRGVEEGFKWVNKNVVNKYAIPTEEKAYNWMKEKAGDVIDWAEKQGYSVGATYSNWLEENSRQDNWTSRKDFLLQITAKYIRDLDDRFQAKSEINAMLDTITPESLSNTTNWDFQRGTVDVRDPSQLPVHIFEDGKWGNLRYGTITADGRTFVVPGFDDKGNVSDNKTEFDKGRYFFSIAGDDKRAKDMAESIAKRMRQYIIDRDGPAVEALMNPSQTGLSGINPPMSYRPDAREGISSRDISDSPKISSNDISNLIEQNATDTNQNIENIKKVADNLSEEDKNFIEEIGKAVKKSLLDEKDTAFKAGLTGDKEDVDKFFKDYNTFGEKYGFVAQTLWLADKIIPFVAGSATQVAVGSAEELGKWVYALLSIPGVHFENLSERTDRRLRNIVRRNVTKYEQTYRSGIDTVDMLLDPSQLFEREPLQFESNK